MNNLTHEEHESAIAICEQNQEAALAHQGECEKALRERTAARDAASKAHVEAQRAFDDLGPSGDREPVLTRAKRIDESEQRQHARAVQAVADSVAARESASQALGVARSAHRALRYQDALAELDRNAVEFQEETLSTLRTLKKRKALIAKARALGGSGWVPDFALPLVNGVHQISQSLEDHVRQLCYVSANTSIDDKLGDVE